MNAIVIANLTLRFLLELAGLAATAWWGFTTQSGLLAWIAGLGLPIVMATFWGVFRVPNDGGTPVVATHPLLRLLFEAAFFALAVGLLFAAGQPTFATIVLILVVINYGLDYRRTLSLLAGRIPATNAAADAFGIGNGKRPR